MFAQALMWYAYAQVWGYLKVLCLSLVQKFLKTLGEILQQTHDLWNRLILSLIRILGLSIISLVYHTYEH